MALSPALESIRGAQELYDWFGYWPDFHDAVVTKLHLCLGASLLAIHTWKMTNRVDAKGFYETEMHVAVEFDLEGITAATLNDLWENSILLDLTINRIDNGFRLDLLSAYGLSGTIEAETLSLHITPGAPA
jgi:hypothetical protein